MKGKIKFFKWEKKFGFIVGQDNRDYFFYISDVLNLYHPKADDEVKFDVTKNNVGFKAINVQGVKDE